MHDIKEIALLVADIHFDLFENLTPVEDEFLMTKRLKEISDAFLFVAQKAAEKNIPLIVLGDLFHKRVMRNDVVNIVVREALFSALELGVPNIILLDGNHDQLAVSGAISSLDLFKNESRIKVISSPTILESVGEYKGLPFIFMPFKETVEYREGLEFLFSLEKFKTYKRLNLPMVFCSHIGISGAKISGFERGGRETIEVNELHPDWFSKVFLGHYHLHQSLGKNVQYIGSLVPHSFKDLDNNRGYVELFYDKTNNIVGSEFYRVPSPRFLSVSFDEFKDMSNTDDCYIKVTGVDKKDAQLLGDSRVKIVENNKEIIQDNPEGISLSNSMDNILQEYLTSVCEDIRKRRVLLKLGKEILYGN